ncbi:hypothetical protein OIDMADRAFT_58207 [Oidiodendron maius Zn]|uniref:DUF4185 domain-containing protein n=1 Tax=Oidiodendron maius (strain Zn) TaxID=913774 RepID=A0A0C3CFA8_OIDMZ|nr:hypothetical protein OIDMADRAFT_58207 [Oidiodendron maius Zn]
MPTVSTVMVGGGAFQNGYHVQVFADSITNLNGMGIVHNSVAYAGYVCSLSPYSCMGNTYWLCIQRVKDDPLDLYTFGMAGPAGEAQFDMTPLGAQGNETETSGFAIWMLSAMTPLSDGKTILGVFPAIVETSTSITNLYSTTVSMEVVNPTTLAPGQTPPIKRPGNGRLFYPNEVQYGNFVLVQGIDGYLYLAGSDTTGIKLARIPADLDLVADRTTTNNAEGNIMKWNSFDLAGRKICPDVGDMWFDNFHQTMVMIWGDAGIDGQVWFSYAINNDIAGTWSELQAIWQTPLTELYSRSTEDWNYQIHTHPGWDETGKTLLIRYSSCAAYVSYTQITWASG